MKKITALVAALAIALSLTACGDSSNTSLIGKLIGQGANTNNSSSEKSKTKIDKNTNDVIGDMGSTETFTTAKTEKITVTETSKTETSAQNAGYVSEEKKSFKFDGGSIECVEYKYYVLDEYESVTEYINFSARIKLNDYPDSEKVINNALAEIGNMPSEEVLMASKAPDSMDYGMMLEHNQILSIYVENNLLFFTTNYLWDGGGWSSSSVIGYYVPYIFDLKTGKQLEVEQLFNDFNKVKQLVVDYADKYVKENIPYEDYSQEPYYEKLINNEWYNGSWIYDGENFTVLYFYLFPEFMYKTIYVDIPADVIRPYFVSESGNAGNGGSTMLSDIVGYTMFDDPYNRDLNKNVDVSLANISEETRQKIINDLEHCIDMAWAMQSASGTSFEKDDKLLFDDTYIQSEYYAVDYGDADAIFEDARACFTYNFISDTDLENKLFDGNYPPFVLWDGQPAWALSYPNPKGRYDFENAGVVSYSDTEAEVWVGYIFPIDWDFGVYIFNIERDNVLGKWKINRVRVDRYYFDEIVERGIDGI